METASKSTGSGSSLSLYLTSIRAFPALTREKEIQLGLQAAGGHRDSQDDLVTGSLAYVVKIALQYRNMGLPFEDLLNEGNIGLIHAAARYDHRQGVRFITYAAWWVRKAILSALALRAPMIRVPGHQLRKLALKRAETERPPKPRGDVAGPRRADWHELSRGTTFRPLSLDAPLPGTNGRPLAEILVEPRARAADRAGRHAEAARPAAAVRRDATGATRDSGAAWLAAIA